MRARSQKWLWIIAIWFGASLCAALGLVRDALVDFEARTWDWRLSAISRQISHNPTIKIIMVDQASLDHFAKAEKIFWPWPRSLYIPVLEFLAQAGAKGVAFDMLFSETGTHVDDDVQFVDAVRRTLPVVSAVALRSSGREEDHVSCQELERFRVNGDRETFEGFSSPRFPGALLPIPELLRASASVGNVTSLADRDGIFRRVWPGAFCGDITVRSLPLALATLGTSNEREPKRYIRFVESTGRLLIRFFGGAGTYDSYSMSSIVTSFLQIQEGQKPLVSPSEFTDAYVFVGTNAPGLLDLRSIPLGGVYSGVELNATILDNILGGYFLKKLEGWPAIILTALLLMCAGLVVVLVHRYQLFVALTLIVSWVVCAFAGAWLGWWIPLVIPLLGMAAVMALGFFAHYRIEGRQSRFIRSAFQHYVTAEVVDKIIADPSLLTLGGERRELTMFFSDIEGFTTLSESMSPADLVRFLNIFLSEMTAIILAEQGTIDKYEGDAIIAFWNAPLPIPDHQERAVRTALRLQERLVELGPFFKKEFGVQPRMRIGINTGIVTVGNFGSSKRFNYTMIGDAANLAARLEGTNKVFGTRILVSEATQATVKDRFVWRRLGDVQVKGKSRVVRVFEPMHHDKPRLTKEEIVTFENGLTLFESGDSEKALEKFISLRNDPASGAYCERIGSMNAGSLRQSAVWILGEK